MAGSNGFNLKVEGLYKYFPVRKGLFQRVSGWVKAVDGVDFEIPQGKTLGLVGESGCGKSTVARLVLRLLEPDEGRILFQGRDLGPLSPAELRPLRRRMQIVFQDPYGSLNPRMTVGQSIEEGLRTLRLRAGERKERVSSLLEMVGLPAAAADRYPHEFSGGQRQRVGIARALSVEPSLLLCDEPVSALDVSIQAQVINLLKDLQKRLGLSYLFIAHDLNVVGYMSDQVAVMYLGKIMEVAPAQALFENPAHPYTRALLAAVPDPDPSSGKGLAVLGGEVPTPINPPPGCRFQGRCPLVEERCMQEEVAMHLISPGHEVRCWKADLGERARFSP